MAGHDQIGDFFRAHGAMVYRRARRILGNDADAEEAVQEVFVRAMNHLDSWQGRGQVTTWLYRITTNYCLNKIRDGKRRRELIDEKVAPEVINRPRSASDMALVRVLLARAPDGRWADAALCVYVDGMSHEEAAEVLEVSKRTVGNLLERFTSWANEYTAGAEGEAS